tara:strand:- start:30383 stop:30949 length:567 start_codon:yes stop_codon:yes gene_type:complete
MASFKLNIADPKAAKCYKTEVKDAQAAPFMGLNIGEKIEGSKIGIEGYEFSITGGTDFCGFPMRHGILGIRKKLTIYPGTGFRGGLKGMKKRKTVCGHKINESISAINLKVMKEGTKKLSDLFGAKKEGEEQPKEEKTEVKKEEKPEQKETKQENKPEQKEAKPKEEPKKEEKQEAKQDKPATKEQKQ